MPLPERNTEEEDEVYYDGWGYAHSLAEERRKRKRWSFELEVIFYCC